MKRHMYLTAILVLALFSFACSEKDDNPINEDILGYSMEQFAPQATVALATDNSADSLELRELYHYEIVAVDGWSPRQSPNAGFDLPFSDLRQTYLVPSDAYRIWHSLAHLPSAFKVRDAAQLRLYRKIDLEDNRGSVAVQLGALERYSITNHAGESEEAIKLIDLLAAYSSFDSLSIVCYDGYGEGMYYPPQAALDGYYLLQTERTIFPTATLPNNQKRMKKVQSLKVFGGIPAEHSYGLADAEEADLVFEIPRSLAGYTSTVMTP